MPSDRVPVPAAGPSEYVSSSPRRFGRSRLRGGRHLAAVVLSVLVAACGGGAPGEADAPTRAPAPAAALAPLTGPAAWQGDLPCADCEGIRTVLVLDPDGTYRMQEGYLGRGAGADTLVAGYGRWILSPNGERITLHGAGESPRYYSPRADGTLRMLDQEGDEITSELNYTLAGLPSVPPLGGRIRVLAAFSYMADAALLVECASGLQLPVAMEGAYLELERGYGASGVDPGAPLLVRVGGRVEDRPAMEGDGVERAFVVDGHEAAAGADCQALAVREALASGEWRLVSLGGDPVDAPAGGRGVPTLLWDRGESRLGGNAGCNSYTGRGVLRGTLLVTGPAVATRMFCEGAMELEQRFLETIQEGGALRLDGGDLVLFRGPREGARFRRG